MQREEIAKEINVADKASINFHTDHSKGSLAKVLTKIAEGGINLEQASIYAYPRQRLEIFISCRP